MNPQTSFNTDRSRRGVALVIVLSMLVLMSAVLVAFMGSVSTERAAQRAAYSGFEAQQAAESAVNLVISQIRQATSNDNGTVGWASQPGAIRTFGGGNNTVFKLYSALDMQEAESAYKPDSPDESGISGSALSETRPGFVDINQPVLTPGPEPGSVEPHYPIVDPRAGLTRDGRMTNGTDSRVEGFWTPQNILHVSGKKDSAGIPIMEVPMRVRWLYQLKDGTMIAPDKSGDIAEASKDNPPVARVAFWTDDESSKLNLNTAGENTFWDTPMASGANEAGNATSKNVIYTGATAGSAALGAAQPTAGEYQRFAGHPATTNLSPALRWLYPPATSTVYNDWQFKESLYRLLPRLRGGYGSSMAATLANFDDFGTLDYRLPKRDRLFATLDEFWFRPDRSPISKPGFFGVFRTDSASVHPDQEYMDKDPGLNLTPQALEQLRFFLTTTSRAPDLNMFGHPRVSIWPVHEIDDPIPANSKRSGYDDLIGFTSSVSSKAYYFTRKDPWSPTTDLMESGPKPVHPLPDQPRRNRKLLFAMSPGDPEGYLQRMGKKSIPGVGGSLAAKYGQLDPTGAFTEYERILLSIFDYIRCVNLVDTGRKDLGSSPAGGYKLAYTPGYTIKHPPTASDYGSGVKSVLGSGQVVPSVVYNAGVPVIKGFGRFCNVSEVALLFYRDNTKLPGDDDVPTGTANTDYFGIRCVLLPEMWTVSPGYPALSEGYAFRVKETQPFKISASSAPAAVNLNLGDPIGDLCYVDVNPYRIPDGRFYMPTRAFNNLFVYDSNDKNRASKTFSKPNKQNNSLSYQNYPFYSKRFDVRKPTTPDDAKLPTEFTLEAGTLEFEFYRLDIKNAAAPNLGAPAVVTEPLQRVTVTFPSVTLPVPNPDTPFQTRILTNPGNNGRSWVTNNDIIRSKESNGLAKGDLRMIAGLTNVTDLYFGTSGAAADYQKKSEPRLHNFRNSWGRGFDGARYGHLAGNGSAPLGTTVRGGYAATNDKIEKVPLVNGSAISVDLSTVGDFDRGMSKHTDGPFINRPDEGNTRFDMSDGDVAGGGHIPYFRGSGGYEEVGETYFSPNRMMPSAVMFGSLPTGLFAGRPWETLLFAPPTSAGHRGASAASGPADHYLLDFFHMPIVEPYAISEPLSTMGKINLNSRLAPFGYVKVGDRSYIQRHTGLHGVFKGLKQFLIPNGTTHNGHPESPLKYNTKYRYEVDPEAMTREIIDNYLDDKDYFKYASEICGLDLRFEDSTKQFTPTLAGRKAFWENHRMTGDNARERLYAHIYPRLTTKSNVFTVHVWAQSIAKNPSTKKDDWGKFDDSKDRVLGEYRGSTTIERYIDANDKTLENYDIVENPNERGLDPFYRFRIINQKRFTPN